MFDLNDAIKQWKCSFRGTCSVEDVEELESHLEELIEELRDTGLPEEEAFARAVTRIGIPKEVGSEFAKVKSLGDWVLDRFKVLDWPLFFGLILICGMGLAILYSVGANSYYPYFWKKQAIFLGLGFALMFVVAQTTPTRLKRYTPVIYGTSIFLLILVFFVGIEMGEPRRWFRLGGFSFQPSVLTLVTVPMMTAWLLDKREWARTWKGFAIMLALIVLPASLILLQLISLIREGTDVAESYRYVRLAAFTAKRS